MCRSDTVDTVYGLFVWLKSQLITGAESSFTVEH